MATDASSLFTSPEAQANLERVRKIADGPPCSRTGSDYKGNMRYEMSIAHTFYLLAVDQIYKNADWAVANNDLENYTGFSLVAIHSINSHHAFEEEVWFPAVEKAAGKPGHLTANIDQHHEFAPHIRALEAYFMAHHAALTPPHAKPLVPLAHPDAATDMKRFGLDPTAPFDPAKVKAVLEDMSGPFCRHLADELDTIGPDLFENVSRKESRAIIATVESYLQSQDPSTFLTIAYSMIDPGLVKTVIPLPWFIRWFLFPYVFVPKHKGFWRYALYPQNIGLRF